MSLRIMADDLRVRIGGAEILRGISFDLGAGELMTVIGPNGAGKSTLLRCLDGIVPATGGRIEIDGEEVGSYSRRELARTVSFVPQGDALALDYSVRAFVEMGRFPHLKAWAAMTIDDRDAVAEAMELTGVGDLADRSLSTLSGGERQRASIAAALAQGGSILLLDEPTSFLDYPHQVQILDLIDRLHRERGLTVIAVTHDLNSTVAVSDQVLALDAGRVAFSGPPAELLDRDTLTGIYGADFTLVPGGRRGLPLVFPSRNGS